MVDEFSAFARTPKPQMEDARHPRRRARLPCCDRQMATTATSPSTPRSARSPIIVTCDRRLMAQADPQSRQERPGGDPGVRARTPDREPGWRGAHRDDRAPQRRPRRHRGDRQRPGLPKHNRNRLLEPYVTTKGNKGTGLGLAIVQKSVEQHGGTLVAGGRAAGARTHARRAAAHLAAGEQVAGGRSHRPRTARSRRRRRRRMIANE